MTTPIPTFIDSSPLHIPPLPTDPHLRSLPLGDIHSNLSSIDHHNGTDDDPIIPTQLLHRIPKKILALLEGGNINNRGGGDDGSSGGVGGGNRAGGAVVTSSEGGRNTLPMDTDEDEGDTRSGGDTQPLFSDPNFGRIPSQLSTTTVTRTRVRRVSRGGGETAADAGAGTRTREEEVVGPLSPTPGVHVLEHYRRTASAEINTGTGRPAMVFTREVEKDPLVVGGSIPAFASGNGGSGGGDDDVGGFGEGGGELQIRDPQSLPTYVDAIDKLFSLVHSHPDIPPDDDNNDNSELDPTGFSDEIVELPPFPPVPKSLSLIPRLLSHPLFGPREHLYTLRRPEVKRVLGEWLGRWVWQGPQPDDDQMDGDEVGNWAKELLGLENLEVRYRQDDNENQQTKNKRTSTKKKQKRRNAMQYVEDEDVEPELSSGSSSSSSTTSSDSDDSDSNATDTDFDYEPDSHSHIYDPSTLLELYHLSTKPLSSRPLAPIPSTSNSPSGFTNSPNKTPKPGLLRSLSFSSQQQQQLDTPKPRRQEVLSFEEGSSFNKKGGKELSEKGANSKKKGKGKDKKNKRKQKKKKKIAEPVTLGPSGAPSPPESSIPSHLDVKYRLEAMQKRVKGKGKAKVKSTKDGRQGKGKGGDDSEKVNKMKKKKDIKGKGKMIINDDGYPSPPSSSSSDSEDDYYEEELDNTDDDDEETTMMNGVGKGKICGKVFQEGELVYRCLQCSLDSTCVLCSACFHASLHSSLKHDISVSMHSGLGTGCCDCGDEEAWNSESVEGAMSCKIHQGAGDKTGMMEEGEGEDEDEEEKENVIKEEKMAKALRTKMFDQIAGLIDWVIEVLETCHNNDQLKPPRSVGDHEDRWKGELDWFMKGIVEQVEIATSEVNGNGKGKGKVGVDDNDEGSRGRTKKSRDNAMGMDIDEDELETNHMSSLPLSSPSASRSRPVSAVSPTESSRSTPTGGPSRLLSRTSSPTPPIPLGAQNRVLAQARTAAQPLPDVPTTVRNSAFDFSRRLRATQLINQNGVFAALNDPEFTRLFPEGINWDELDVELQEAAAELAAENDDYDVEDVVLGVGMGIGGRDNPDAGDADANRLRVRDEARIARQANGGPLDQDEDEDADLDPATPIPVFRNVNQQQTIRMPGDIGLDPDGDPDADQDVNMPLPTTNTDDDRGGRPRGVPGHQTQTFASWARQLRTFHDSRAAAVAAEAAVGEENAGGSTSRSFGGPGSVFSRIFNRDLASLPGQLRKGEAKKKKRGPWSVVVWNDETHSFPQVISSLVKATGCSRAEASRSANRVDTYGRDIVYVTSDPLKACRVAKEINAIGLGATVRPSMLAFMEDLCSYVIAWLRDLLNLKVKGREGFVREVMTEVLLAPTAAGSLRSQWTKGRDEFCPPPESELVDTGRDGKKFPTRFQQLLLRDSRLWKDPQSGLRSLYIALMVTGPETKLQMGRQMAVVYPQLAQGYLLVDQDPESSILHFNIQLLTTPSVATDLVKNSTLPHSRNFFTTIIDILHACCTGQVGPDKKRPRFLVLPPRKPRDLTDTQSHCALGERFLKLRRLYQLFHDVQFSIEWPGVKDAIRNDLSSIRAVIQFLSIFSGMNPQRRAQHEHVEYESEKWVIAFNMTINIAKLARGVGECFRRCTPSDMARVLGVILHLIGTGHGSERLQMNNCRYRGAIYPCVSFVVAQEDNSFHYPLTWFLAEVLKNVSALDPDAMGRKLGPDGPRSLEQIVTRSVGKLTFLFLLDKPLRIAAWLAQIRAGLWVRNGYSVWSQQLHYREFNLRPNTFDQDVYLLQCGMTVLDPSHFLVSLMERFGVTAWLGGDGPPSWKDDSMLALMEELISFLIILLSEPINVLGFTKVQIVRRLLIHSLVLGPLSYSDLLKRISEDADVEDTTTQALRDIADYKPPTGPNDRGKYSLKSHCLHEVNPRLYLYSRSQREEAERRLKEDITKRTRVKDPVVPPKVLGIKSGMFAPLSYVYQTDVFLDILYFSFQRGRPGDDFSATVADTLVDETLHLAMMAYVEQPEVFTTLAYSRMLTDIQGQKTLLQLLCVMEGDSRLESLHPRIKWLLDRMAETASPRMAPSRQSQPFPSAPSTPDPHAKKAAAKARKEALMKQFVKAQEDFEASAANEDLTDEERLDEAEGGSTAVYGSCIFCQDELHVGGQAFGALGFIQPSKHLRRTPDSSEWMAEILDLPASLDHDASAIRPFGVSGKRQASNIYGENDGMGKGFPRETIQGLHASSCGHFMHLSCFETYLQAAERRHTEQPGRAHPESLARMEFVCPLCKSLGNVILPAPERQRAEAPYDPRSVDSWLANPLEHSSWDIQTLGLQKSTEVHKLLVHDGSGRLKAWYTTFFTTRPNLQVDPTLVSPGERTVLRRFFQVSQALSEETQGADKAAYLAENLVGYTLSSIEVALRGVEGGPTLAASLTEPQTMLLRSLLRVMRLMTMLDSNSGQSKDLTAWALVLRLLANGKTKNQFFRAPLLEREPLAIVIETAAVAPAFFHHVVGLMFYSEATRLTVAIMALFRRAPHTAAELARTLDPKVKREGSLNEDICLALARIRGGIPCLTDDPVEDRLLGILLRYYTLPFLRRCAILHSVIHHRDPTAPTSRADNILDEDEEFEREAREQLRDEYERLLELLEIPNPVDVLPAQASPAEAISASDTVRNYLLIAVRRWQASVAISLKGPNAPKDFVISPYFLEHLMSPPSIGSSLSWSQKIELLHPCIYELVGLPRTAATLIEKCLHSKCKRCGRRPEIPAICLNCGELVCEMTSCCMQGREGGIGGPLRRPLGQRQRRPRVGRGLVVLDPALAGLLEQAAVDPDPDLMAALGASEADLDHVEGEAHAVAQNAAPDIAIQLASAAATEDSDSDSDDDGVVGRGEWGECNAHMWECESHTSMYFLVKKSAILILSANKVGGHLPAPYLDVHGESTGLKSLPLFLNQSRYDILRKMWLDQQIPTQIARRLDSIIFDSGGWPAL